VHLLFEFGQQFLCKFVDSVLETQGEYCKRDGGKRPRGLLQFAVSVGNLETFISIWKIDFVVLKKTMVIKRQESKNVDTALLVGKWLGVSLDLGRLLGVLIKKSFGTWPEGVTL
jgi:hypothetical protein